MTHREFRYQIAVSLKMRYMPPAPVRSLISRSELRLDRTKKPYAYSWRYFVLPDVFTKICHKKSDVEALPPHRLKRDKPKRGHGLGRQNRRNELIEPTPSTSKE
ncbi:hypothetical protein EVAR_23623_1 [Eumeta japonica]|uniref:Uncharacterized protein n=1 Tax=Eumeta variegata TaxID=151549 RepID=A0A4C1WZ24_EUMVA|nr:hypothetical protein EVAR_23623_1 [Eumeta japonica]